MLKLNVYVHFQSEACQYLALDKYSVCANIIFLPELNSLPCKSLWHIWAVVPAAPSLPEEWFNREKSDRVSVNYNIVTASHLLLVFG